MNASLVDVLIYGRVTSLVCMNMYLTVEGDVRRRESARDWRESSIFKCPFIVNIEAFAAF